MEATAKVTFVRIAPRKVKIVLDLIRNQPADKAAAILKYTPKAACEVVAKLLKSAVANAENKDMDTSGMLRRSGPDPQADPSARPGPCEPYQQEDISHHPCSQGSGIIKEEVKQWARKSILTA